MKIAHLSDLHFGTLEAPNIETALQNVLREAGADFVVMSGDFTQNAHRAEFSQAKRFIDSLGLPTLSVPGNHDVPGFSLFQRLFYPWVRYREYIDDTLCPVYEDDFVVIAGLNSARPMVPHWNWANGALSAEQRKKAEDIFKGKADKWCICTFHHPVHKADYMPIDVVVFGGKKMMSTLLENRVDLVLTGHVHHGSITTHSNGQHSCVYLSAPSATSRRLRGQPNGFNLITLSQDEMQVDLYNFTDGGSFEIRETYNLKRA